ncbi:MAG: flavodoxin-dependent (E)-4-hydroxy-3-methylbut-2-enyl-diphosphate synthase [bacterium]|nr:MAG: flavodoxin-dependent (E)-4-hydroxy-3-methylbut-2-enyl-diphosphate synthase [bacterium]
MTEQLRRKTRPVRYGTLTVGGGAPVSIQSMSTCPAAEKERVRAEIESLTAAGCELVRVAVRDDGDVEALSEICRKSTIPVVADIHFDASLAVRAAGTGVAGLRINPGNIGGKEKIEEVIDAAAGAGIPVRIGVNAGSIERELRGLYRTEPARALYESAANHLRMIERLGFRDLVFSLKSSDPLVTVEANRLFAGDNDYPIHIGVTEAGPPLSGTARSVVALTLLLSSGIGDTVRISLSGDPVREVVAAGAMLSVLGLRDDFPEIVSCPTCGRMRMDVAGIAERLERELLGLRTNLKVAVMGCEVNGPGEAREADIGIAGTRGGAVLFKHGEVVRKLTGDFVEEFLREVRRLFGAKG